MKNQSMKFPIRWNLWIVAAMFAALLPVAAKADNSVTFQRTDEPGRWFKNLAGHPQRLQRMGAKPAG